MKLLKYDLKFEYMPGKYLYIADYVSRNYSNEKVEEDKEMCEVVHSLEKHLRMSESKKEEFRRATLNDEILKKVMECCRKDWKEKTYVGESLLQS
ncbi:hypothetical protein QE152_g14127 [Popillia japonica]|uniref:Uncharacterized protein n=1 Tax=Popillia japonica TaxID=7064 RepID=A0AAW1LAJ1_POPJA